MKQTAREFDLCPARPSYLMNGIACGPSLRLRAVASSNGATTCLAPRGQGLFLLRTSTPSPLRSQTLLNGFSTAWTLEVNNFCSTLSLHLLTRVHQRPSRHELRSFSSLPIRRCPELSIWYCSFRLSPRYVRFHYVCPDPRSFRVVLF